MKKVDEKADRLGNFNQLVMLNAWGAVLVVASFLFLFVGRWIDVQLNTQPFFMIGMLILAISLIFARLFKESNKIKNEMAMIRKHHA